MSAAAPMSIVPATRPPNTIARSPDDAVFFMARPLGDIALEEAVIIEAPRCRCTVERALSRSCVGNVASAYESAPHTALEAAVHPARIPTRCQWPLDFRSFQTNPGENGAGQAPSVLSIGQREDPAIEHGLLEGLGPALLERLMDVRLAQAQARGQRKQHPLRAAGVLRIRIIGKERAVGSQGLTGEQAHRPLESGIAAGVLACVVIREAVKVQVVGRLIIEQVGDAEIDAGTPSKQLVTQIPP